MKDERGWRRLGWIGLLIEAWVMLGIMAVAVRVLTFRRIAGLLGFVERRDDAPVQATEPGAERIAAALQKAAASTPVPYGNCLCQALAGAVLLTRRRLPAVLYLGVAPGKTEGDHFRAHAWLSSGAIDVSGGRTCAGFAPLAAFEKRKA